MDEPCCAESSLVAEPDVKIKRVLLGRLLLLVAGGAFISSTDLCLEQLNSSFISQYGELSAWYVVANIYSTVFGFYTEVLVPWQLDKRVPRAAFWILGAWVMLWDNGCRLAWLFLERAARAAGEAPSRTAITWAMGNDVNSLLLVPLACSYFASTRPSEEYLPNSDSLESEESRGSAEGWSPPRGFSPMVIACGFLGLAMTLLDAWIFQVQILWTTMDLSVVCEEGSPTVPSKLLQSFGCA